MAGCNSKLSNAAANAAMGDTSHLGLIALLNGGKMHLYSGSQPASPDTVVVTAGGANVDLGNVGLNATIGVVTNGNISLNPVTNATCLATNTATWFRIYNSVGDQSGPGLWDGNVNTGTPGTDADLCFSSCAFILGGTINITGFLTIPAH